MCIRDRHVMNIQTDVCGRCGYDDIKLPVLPYYTTPKLILMHITGIKTFCKLNNLFHTIWRSNH